MWGLRRMPARPPRARIAAFAKPAEPSGRRAPQAEPRGSTREAEAVTGTLTQTRRRLRKDGGPLRRRRRSETASGARRKAARAWAGVAAPAPIANAPARAR